VCVTAATTLPCEPWRLLLPRAGPDGLHRSWAALLAVRSALPARTFTAPQQQQVVAQSAELQEAPGPLSRSTLLRSSAMLPAAAWPFAASAGAKVGGDAVVLNNKLSFQVASFGLQVYDDATAEELTKTSLEVGFRNFFASVLARNQKGFARGFKASGVPREDVFICGSVLSNQATDFNSAYELTKRGCDENLKAFAVGGIDYVDMIMLDYPCRDCDSIRGQWKAFEEMLASGKTKSLAVSNFSPAQLDCILQDKTATVPTVNQLPYAVGSFGPTDVEENRKRGIIVQAWSPLSSGSSKGKRVCKEIGQKYGKSGTQVELRWIVQSGATYSMQTKKRSHFEEDLNIFDFQLTQEEMDKISSSNSQR